MNQMALILIPQGMSIGDKYLDPGNIDCQWHFQFFRYDTCDLGSDYIV